MAASTNDMFKKVGDATVTTLAAPGKAMGATSITVGSTTNYPTDTGVIIAIRVVDTSGELVAGTYTEFSGTITSGTTIGIVATPVYGSDQVYAAGSTTQVYIGLSKYGYNTLIEGILAQHAQDGTHTAITATSVDSSTFVKADTISEHTAAAGVTIDSFAIKDGSPKNWDGWVTPDETWTYASASTFTVAGDQTAKYTAGTRLKWTQTTVKYGVVVSSTYGAPNTTVTIAVNTDYTIANAAITANYYSYAANPQGYPGEFNYDATWTNVTGGTENYAIFSMIGKQVTYRIKYTLAGAGVSGATIFSLPVTAGSNQSGDVALAMNGYYLDSGNNTYPALCIFNSTTTINVRPINAAATYVTNGANASSTVPFTFGSADVISAAGIYMAA